MKVLATLAILGFMTSGCAFMVITNCEIIDSEMAKDLADTSPGFDLPNLNINVGTLDMKKPPSTGETVSPDIIVVPQSMDTPVGMRGLTPAEYWYEY